MEIFVIFPVNTVKRVEEPVHGRGGNIAGDNDMSVAIRVFVVIFVALTILEEAEHFRHASSKNRLTRKKQ